MARSHGKILADIWNDDTWVALNDGAQRLYMLLLTQPKLNLAGALDVLPTRWARLASNTTVETINEALSELETAGYIVVDHATEELVIRTFVRHDITPGGWNRNIAKGLWSAWKSIASPTLRHCVIAHLPDHIWAKDHGIEVPQEAKDLRCRSWVPNGGADAAQTPTKPAFEPQVQSRFEPQLDPRFEPPSTVNRQPSTPDRSSLQRDVYSQGAPENLAAATMDQAVEIVMERRGKNTPPADVRNAGGWIAKARAGIAEELAAVQAQHPDWSANQLADTLDGVRVGTTPLPVDPRPVVPDFEPQSITIAPPETAASSLAEARASIGRPRLSDSA